MDSCEEEPWITFNKATGILGGNKSGFERLGNSIDRLLAGEGGSIAIEGEEVEIREIQLADKPIDIPRPPLGSHTRFAAFLVLLILLLVLAGVGVVASVNWLISTS